MFKKILIANRGEIAVRIIRACRDMGIISVAVYSEADADALHTQIADEAICIGPPRSAESYLDQRRILSAALVSGAGAIHPGYGFLSENPEFVALCEEYGVAFIGPTARTISLMGNKAQAKRTMISAGVPVIPGSDGPVPDLGAALRAAKDIGYPLLVKAASGGGGRGIRLARSEEELCKVYPAARSEAMACFGDDSVYLERFLVCPRHIEFQILADSHGNAVHLFERDCSIQRRHQKMLEESPSPFLTDELRRRMGEAAVAAAKAADYVNAGTIEFLVDLDGSFYFMEMNTRIQVEHPVTELVTGVDLIREQIRIAAGEPLSVDQEDLRQSGHAIECRVNAEDPNRGFMPCPGTLYSLNVPGGPGVRVDGAMYQGYVVPPYYDSMLAKLIVHAPTRPDAIAMMKRALSEFLFEGITTNTDFLLALLCEPDFNSGAYDINFLESHTIRMKSGE